jgi:transcription antitermination factor NusG
METRTEINTMKSPFHGTDDGEACSLRWYAARTQMNCERKVEKHFQQLAAETYLPVQEEIHQWSDRKKRVKRLVIPMVLFVKISKKDVFNFHSNVDSQFYGFITTDRAGRIPAEISDREMETFRFMLDNSDSTVEITDSSYTNGDSVRVVRGPLRGLEGEIVNVNDRKGALVVPINCIGNAVVSIDLINVERMEPR